MHTLVQTGVLKKKFLTGLPCHWAVRRLVNKTISNKKVFSILTLTNSITTTTCTSLLSLTSRIKIPTPQSLTDSTHSACHAATSGHGHGRVPHATEQGLFKGTLRHARVVEVGEGRAHAR